MRFIPRLNEVGALRVVQNAGPFGSAFAVRGAGDGSDADGVSYATNPQIIATRAADTTPRPSGGFTPPGGAGRRVDRRMALLETQCVKLSLSLLARANNPAKSVGFTSAVSGEGKSFLATLTATALARQSHMPITLVDCNWEHPTLHSTFGIPDSPGLAEWLRLECSLDDIRHIVSSGLTVIPAGVANDDTVALTGALKAAGLQALLTHPDEVLIVDMAPVLTTSYGALLSQQLDSVLLVVRAGSTWDSYIQEASYELSASPVEGIVLNATRSRIPQWLQRML